MANLKKGIRRLTVALGCLVAGGWALFSILVLLNDGIPVSEFITFGVGGAAVLFGLVWGLVRILGWAVLGFTDQGQ